MGLTEKAAKALEGRFTRIARTFARNRNVTVRLAGTACNTDGVSVINLPANADYLTDENKEILEGMLDHEWSHCDAEQECAEMRAKGLWWPSPNEIMKEAKSKAERLMLNVYEDVRIEAKQAAKYVGVGQNLSTLNDVLTTRIAIDLKKREARGIRPDWWWALGCVIMDRSAKRNDEHWPADLRALADTLGDIIERSRKTRHAGDSLDLARETMARVKAAAEAEEERKRKEAEEKAKKAAEKAKKEAEKAAKEPAPKEPKPKPEPAPKADKPEEVPPPPAGDDGEDEDGEPEADEPDDEEGGKGEHEEPTGDKGESSGASDDPDAEDGDAGEEAGEEAGEDGAGGEGGDKGESDKGEPGDGEAEEGEEGDSGEEAGDKGESGAGGEGGESEDGEEGEEGEEGGGGSEGDAGDGAGGVGEGGAPSGKEASEGEEAPTATPSGAGEGTADAEEPEAEEPETADDIDAALAAEGAAKLMEKDAHDVDLYDVLRDAIEEAAKGEIRESGRHIPHPEILAKDRVIHVKSNPGLEPTYQRLMDQVRPQISALRSKLLTVLFARKAVRFEGDRERGSIDSGALYSLRGGNKRVFGERVSEPLVNTVVGILVDQSGSMASGGRAEQARLACIAVAETLHRVNIPFAVWGFTDSFRITVPSHPLFNRTQAAILNVFKDFGDNYLRVRTALVEIHAMEDNADGEHVMKCAKALAMRPEPRKILIVLSDGNPQCMHSNRGALAQDLKDTVARIERAGIEVHGVGLQTDAPRSYYKRHTNIMNMAELPVKLFKLLKGSLLSE